MWLVIHIANIFFLLGLGTLIYKVLGGGSKRCIGLHAFFKWVSRMTGAMLVLLAAIFSVILVLQMIAIF